MEARINCINFVLKSKTCSRGGHTESGNQEIITYWSWVGAENKTNSSAHFHPILMLCELPFLFGLIHTKSPITEQNRFFVDREKENDEKTTGRKIYPPQVWTAHTKLQKIFFISVCEILWNVCAWVLARARHHQEWKPLKNRTNEKSMKMRTTAMANKRDAYRMQSRNTSWILLTVRGARAVEQTRPFGSWHVKKEERPDAGNNIIGRRPLWNALDRGESMAAVTFQLKTLSLPICCSCALCFPQIERPSESRTQESKRKKHEK